MEESLNPHTLTDCPGVCGTNVVAQAAWHGLFWLVAANGVGVLLAVLLLVPSLNPALGEWTYGRWMMVHMNLELYGWTSLPLVGYLFHVYGVGRGSMAYWCRPVLWVWSGSLGVGVVSWLTGHSSGKLFLDWSGYARILFSDALLTLWFLLVIALVADWKSDDGVTVAAWGVQSFWGSRFFYQCLLCSILLQAPETILRSIPRPAGQPAQASSNLRLPSCSSLFCFLWVLPRRSQENRA